LSNSPEESNNANNEQQQPAQQQEQTQPITTPTSNTGSGGGGGGAEGGFAEYFDKMLQGYGEEYMKQVMEMADQKQYVITLNELEMDSNGNPKTEPDPLDPEIKRPIYKGMTDKPYTSCPISPQDWHRAEKLRAKFQAEKDPDKVADNQINTYKFLAFCYLKMPASEFDRIADWNQLKMAVDACNFRTLYRPLKK